MLISEESIHFDPTLTLQNHPWMSPKLGCQLRERNKLRWQHGSCVSYSASISCFSHFVCPRRLLTCKRKKGSVEGQTGCKWDWRNSNTIVQITVKCFFLPSMILNQRCYDLIFSMPFLQNATEFVLDPIFFFLTLKNFSIFSLVATLQKSSVQYVGFKEVQVSAWQGCLYVFQLSLSMFIRNGPNSGNLTTL